MYLSGPDAGHEFRRRISKRTLLPLIGVYDVYSALIAAKRFEGVFCSGYSYAASAYGLPDVGYVNWRDITDFSTKIRHVLPLAHILVDVDDGFGDEVVASNTVCNLESNGLSAVMMEDQKRPRRCGHFEGKQILPLDEYLTKLSNVLRMRSSIFVIARTDASDPSEGIERAVSYAEAGADGVMVEAIKDLDTISRLRSHVAIPIMVNQLHGGKSPNWRFDELEDAGASIVIYSTPCLFAAQYGIERYLDMMLELRRLPSECTVSMTDCARLLTDHATEPGTAVARPGVNGTQTALPGVAVECPSKSAVKSQNQRPPENLPGFDIRSTGEVASRFRTPRTMLDEKNKQKVVVVGLGEVGRPLLELVSRYYATVGVDITPVERIEQVSVLHICYPFQIKDFIGETVRYIKLFQPTLTIINSTVAIGTTRSIAEHTGADVVNSPVRGKHACMLDDLSSYTKFVGALDPSVGNRAAKHFHSVGLNTKILPSPEATELAKLTETTYFGLLIAWAQEVERYCDQLGEDYDNIVSFYQDINYLPPVKYFPGVIGGHCVLPNIEILSESQHSVILKAIRLSNEIKIEREAQTRDEERLLPTQAVR